MGKNNKPYSDEQVAFILSHYRGVSRKELTDAFNERFGTDKSVLAIKTWCCARGLKNGFDGRFEKGCTTWQKGVTGEALKAHYTEESYKRSREGITNRRIHKIGDTVMRHGIPMIVVSVEKNLPIDKRFMPKRRYVWEQAYGKIPPHHRIIHLDGDAMNCDLDNLYCVPTKFIPLINKNHWLTDSREHTLTAIKWCELWFAIH